MTRSSSPLTALGGTDKVPRRAHLGVAPLPSARVQVTPAPPRATAIALRAVGLPALKAPPTPAPSLRTLRRATTASAESLSLADRVATATAREVNRRRSLEEAVQLVPMAETASANRQAPPRRRSRRAKAVTRCRRCNA